MTEAQNALTAVDLGAATTALRLAASEVRSLADATSKVEPEAEKHLLRSADALDNAATAASQFDTTNVDSWLSQATNELTQAVDLIGPSDFCST